MILVCPGCHRKYQIDSAYGGKLFRCSCEKILKIPGESVDTKAPGAQSSPTASQTKKETQEQVSTQTERSGHFAKAIFPDFNHLIELSRWGSAQSQTDLAKEADLPDPEEDLPGIDEELPSFDEDDSLIPGSEDIEDNLDSDKEKQEEELTDAQKSSYGNIDMRSGNRFDPRIPKALEELAASKDDQFIVDMLYFLLEVKHPAIKETVVKFKNHANPISAYLADRILTDIQTIVGDEHHKPKPLEPYSRDALAPILYHGSEGQKLQILKKAIDNREFGSVPYFMLQLLLEKNADVITAFLANLGLLAAEPEIPFFAEFIHHPAQKIKLACIEGLTALGGTKTVPVLVSGLVDKDYAITGAIKTALKGADKEDVAVEIMRFCMKNPKAERKGYISVLQEYANPKAFRTLVWFFDDLEIQNLALEAAKDFPIEDEKKIPVLEEYLSFSYDDGKFANEVVEVLEKLFPSYDRSRLNPIHVFDDSYVSMVRLSPLFARDFMEISDTKKDKDLETEFEILPYKRAEFIASWFLELKSQFSSAKSQFRLKNQANQILVASCFYTVFLFLGLIAVSRGFGNFSPKPPFSLFPSSFAFNFGKRIFLDPIFLKALELTFVYGLVAIVLGWLLGSMFAISQLKRRHMKIRFLPAFPLLIPPAILGSAIGNLLSVLNIEFSGIAIILAFSFPFLSIFYLVCLRVFDLISHEGVDIAISLGASTPKAYSTNYSMPYILATLISIPLCLAYLFSSLGITWFIGSEEAMGFYLLQKTQYASGWLFIGSWGLFCLLFSFFSVFLVSMVAPVEFLLPGPSQSGNLNARRLLSCWIAFFGSCQIFRKIKKKKAAPKMEEAPKEGRKNEKVIVKKQETPELKSTHKKDENDDDDDD